MVCRKMYSDLYHFDEYTVITEIEIMWFCFVIKFFFFFLSWSLAIAQAGLELLASSDLPPRPPKVLGLQV